MAIYRFKMSGRVILEILELIEVSARLRYCGGG
ncbi:hypothetical protein CCACVL1_30469 [Corchorus capsularis]|uniref:Uncharacterized protein n=1 Tax=Corchorus capsularis TaxID=210143 RepID=A0A1R3FXB5_COCAP|nr:hypothetical protein CCACVL1_30469 [Corchorus capsularis]